MFSISRLVAIAGFVFVAALICSSRALRAGQSATQEPIAAEMSKKETVSAAFLRGIEYQEYEVRSAAEAMPEEKYS
jgi:hypothetical protein